MRYSKLFVVPAALAVLSAGLVVSSQRSAPARADSPCPRYYVATGDGVVYGTDASDPGKDTDKAYPHHLIDTRLNKNFPAGSGPWCLQNVSYDKTTTDAYVNDKQGSSTSTQQGLGSFYKPTLITVMVGRQNDSLVDSITTCLDHVKHHRYLEANTCALKVLTDQAAFTKLTKDVSGILGKYQTLMAGNPKLVVAVPGYYDPYPHATTVATKIPGFCSKLVDTIPTCIARWILLPPALVSLDLVVKQINSTISAVVQKLATGNQGRFVFVNTYDEMNDHCMRMNVTIHTKVYHPPSTVDQHDAGEENFGCDTSWIGKDGKDVNPGFEPFTYLPPAIDGLLVYADHTTKDLGVNPNDNGHECIATLIWSAVYSKLGWPQSPVPAKDCSKVGV